MVARLVQNAFADTNQMGVCLRVQAEPGALNRQNREVFSCIFFTFLAPNSS